MKLELKLEEVEVFAMLECWNVECVVCWNVGMLECVASNVGKVTSPVTMVVQCSSLLLKLVIH